MHEWGVLGTASTAFSHCEGNKFPRVAVQSQGPGSTPLNTKDQEALPSAWYIPIVLYPYLGARAWSPNISGTERCNSVLLHATANCP